MVEKLSRVTHPPFCSLCKRFVNSFGLVAMGSMAWDQLFGSDGLPLLGASQVDT